MVCACIPFSNKLCAERTADTYISLSADLLNNKVIYRDHTNYSRSFFEKTIISQIGQKEKAEAPGSRLFQQLFFHMSERIFNGL
ncbi:hypothetical protein CRH11_09735 [Bacillus velezensis]|nr:hypothetical protein AJ82_04900 [Bacillus velezensis TrigoCor1448]AIW29143.1 hypothetical protein KO64_04355 [Bacillus subtilis]ASP25495.1 hypothetical protein CG798_10010 [Bacillus velezensis]AWM47132.1 hypothetical protein DDT09_04360 [Bacillus amyloliquefaciens]APH34864.1 hypothetical protein BHE96_04380 [Bacillus subtilis]